MTVLMDEAKLAKFIGLIKWASSRYTRKIPSGDFSYEDLVAEGRLVLAKCLKRWRERKPQLLPKNEGVGTLVPKNEEYIAGIVERDEREFSKFFKASLFHEYAGLCRYLYVKKRIHQEVSLDQDKSLVELPISGFNDVLYRELVDHVASNLSEIPRKIFMLLVDPPEDLCQFAIYRNRRKMKYNKISGKPTSGMNVVRPTSGLILEYLNDNGHRISSSVYYLHMKTIKKVVMEAIKR